MNEFDNEVDNLSDIAHGNALDMIHIDENKLFLLSQRKKGRPGCMLGIDYFSTRKEN